MSKEALQRVTETRKAYDKAQVNETKTFEIYVSAQVATEKARGEYLKALDEAKEAVGI